MKQILSILCLILISAVCFAGIDENAGNYGYKFLNVPYGPVALSLAGRGVYNTDNPGAFLLQPAVSCINDQHLLGISHNLWLADTQANMLAYSYARKVDHFGVSLRNLDYGDLENRDDMGFLIGSYHPVDIDATANYARRLTPSFYLGANLGILYQKLDSASSLALHTDLGFCYLPPLNDTKLAFAFRNFGVANKTEEERVKLPTCFELDVNKGFRLIDQHFYLNGSAIQTMDEDLKGSIGLQCDIFNTLSLRTGYLLGYDAQDFSAGFGVKYKNISVDYGYGDYNSELNDVHSFGVTYRF
ncbi:MAG: PorV/PorQ family protein [Candidatus Cloacimonas sp.]